MRNQQVLQAMMVRMPTFFVVLFSYFLTLHGNTQNIIKSLLLFFQYSLCYIVVVDEAVFVGTCLGTDWYDIDDNVRCSQPTTSSDLNDVTPSDVALYRACPVGTYGRYVYLVSNGKIDLCEIKVHGMEGNQYIPFFSRDCLKKYIS